MMLYAGHLIIVLQCSSVPECILHYSRAVYVWNESIRRNCDFNKAREKIRSFSITISYIYTIGINQNRYHTGKFLRIRFASR